MSVGNNFNNIAGNPNFYSSLRSTLSYEKMVLKALGGNIGGVTRHIELAMVDLQKYGGEIDKLAPTESIKQEMQRLNVSTNDLRKFLDESLKFLMKFRDDLNNIFARIEVEERFLNQSSGRDATTFSAFFDAWEKEMKMNKQLLKHFQNIIERNKKIFRKQFIDRTGGQLLIGSPVIGGASIMALPLMMGGATTAGPAAFVMMGAVGAVTVSGIFAGLITNMFDGYSGMADYSKDEELIRELKKRRKR